MKLFLKFKLFFVWGLIRSHTDIYQILFFRMIKIKIYFLE